MYIKHEKHGKITRQCEYIYRIRGQRDGDMVRQNDRLTDRKNRIHMQFSTILNIVKSKNFIKKRINLIQEMFIIKTIFFIDHNVTEHLLCSCKRTLNKTSTLLFQ